MSSSTHFSHVIPVELIDKTPIDPSPASLTPYKARVWYSWRKANIKDLINKNQSLEMQAKEAFEMRNTIRTKTRQAMKDTDIAEFLDTKEANRTWEDLFNYYGGDYNKIIEGSMKGRNTVDNLFQIPTSK